MIYKTAKQLIDTAVSNEDLYALHNIIKLGDSVCNQIVEERKELFTSKYCIGEKSRLRSLAIYTQFEMGLLAKDFPFTCSPLKVNSFGKYIPELRKGQMILHIAKAQHINELPGSSKYKKEKALLNNFKSKQQSLIQDEILKLDDESYYGIITYGGRDVLEFINLVVPNYEYKEVLECKDLTRLVFKQRVDKKQMNEQMRDRRMALKDALNKKIEKQGV